MNNEIRKEAGVCPQCGKLNLKYLKHIHREESIEFIYTCNECNFKGIEVYSIEFNSHFDRQYNSV